jgi:hypothetical protein
MDGATIQQALLMILNVVIAGVNATGLSVNGLPTAGSSLKPSWRRCTSAQNI